MTEQAKKAVETVGADKIFFDEDDVYECSYCRRVCTGEPATVRMADHDSDDGLPTVLCPGCVAQEEIASLKMEMAELIRTAKRVNADAKNRIAELEAEVGRLKDKLLTHDVTKAIAGASVLNRLPQP